MPIPEMNFVLLFVKSPEESGKFYSKILNLTPVEQSPTFVLFALPNGMQLGLWSNKTARPLVNAPGGGSEICFSEENVDEVYAKWIKLGIPMALPPTKMDGMEKTFVALDPDGHRIRIFRLEEVSHA